MIKIIDYGLGNVLAFLNAYRRINIDVGVATTASELGEATRLILPGVGAFDHAMKALARSGMREALNQRVLGEGVPILGVCVGMQMFARSSDEGHIAGLGWIDAEVRGFSTMGKPELRLPHMGWNDVRALPGKKLFSQLTSLARFYFLHSYYFESTHPDDVSAVANYGAEFCCAVSAGNIHGVQFHPEKSHQCGMQLLRNFAEL
jgi:glutamine amidotransferase